MNRGDSKKTNVANQLFNEQLATKSDLINLNTATAAELETLTGIGTSTAKKILNYREQNGKFKSIEEIKNVSGIGDAKYAAIKDDITV
ncbi:MAG: helix-hairpin-helix domain-containing protein [Clostridia bacterium]|nr:helix-hairpin-helix domain-containing protein [Clostridia bacterium]